MERSPHPTRGALGLALGVAVVLASVAAGSLLADDAAAARTRSGAAEAGANRGHRPAVTAAPTRAAVARTLAGPSTRPLRRAHAKRHAQATSRRTATRDRKAPSTPTGLTQTVRTVDQITIAWTASTDDVGVAGYRIYVDGSAYRSVTGTAYGEGSLPCGTSYWVEVEAYDAAGNRSDRAGIAASTDDCPATAPVPSLESEAALAPQSPLPGTVLEVSGTLSASDLAGRIAAAPAGPVTVRPAPGTTATVTGSFSPPRAGVALNGLTFTDDVTFGPGDDGGQLLGSRARQFNIFGADDVTIAGNVLDGRGQTPSNQIWDQPAGSVPERFRIQGNTLTRFYGPTAGTHSEALYIGYSADGLIEGNTFIDNGTTAHVFFTWWGTTANPATSYPRRVCVRGNSFGALHGAYFDVNFRSEIPTSSGIAIDPAQRASTTDTAFTRACT
jgi:chitodextrinase